MLRHTIAATLILAGGPTLAQEVVRLGTEAAYPPFNFINDAGEVDGFEREFGDELCRRVNVSCTWVPNEWDSIIPNLLAGNYDAIIAAMSIIEARKEFIEYSIPYLKPEATAYVALAGAEDDVILGTVAAQAATFFAAHVAASGADLLEFPTVDEAIGAVLNREADASIDYKSRLTGIVEESGGQLEIVGEDVLIGDGVGMGFRHSDDALRERFDVAIQSMKDDGSLNLLIEKWLGAGRKF